MSTHTVTATFKGERVHLFSETLWPSMRTMLRLSMSEAVVSERAANRLAQLAATDETLTDIKITEVQR